MRHLVPGGQGEREPCHALQPTPQQTRTEQGGAEALAVRGWGPSSLRQVGVSEVHCARRAMTKSINGSTPGQRVASKVTLTFLWHPASFHGGITVLP
ncbi:hypothetical protein E2C01_094858 [Portunus trituberculatus]|uniref:Uncharacterized protein n=1 Tax=Portunus trituberculatus TaxID=210409 RepID=A0A5B7JY11_PORTR|nr:hypothetical protein [Portunus trituberculatus]